MKHQRLLILFLILYATNWCVTIEYKPEYTLINDVFNMGKLSIWIVGTYALLSFLVLIRKVRCYHRHGIRVLRVGDIRCLFQTKSYLLLIPFIIQFTFVFQDKDIGLGKPIASIFSNAPIEQVSEVALAIGKNGNYIVALLLLICLVVEQFNQQIDHKINFKLHSH
jgi:hypothetical protein